MAAPTIQVRFSGDIRDLEVKARQAADRAKQSAETIERAGAKATTATGRWVQKTTATAGKGATDINRLMGGVGKGDAGKNAFSGLTGRFKQLVEQGKKAGQETGDGYMRELDSRAKKSAGKLGALMKGSLLGIGAKLGIDFMGELGSTISGASNLEQSVGGLGAVFKKGFGAMSKAAESAATSVGLSQNAYNELATTLGAGLKNKGIKDYADQTQNLIGIGADLSAQFGGSTQDAVSAIASLMRGERDPIEKYGVAMNESMVQAEALSMGLGKVTKDKSKIVAAQNRAVVAQRKYTEAVKKHGEGSSEALTAEAGLATAQSALTKALEGGKPVLSDQEKAMASLSLLTKQTADAQGAFGRETDTLANKQQRAGAMWENLKAKVGGVALPAVSGFMGFITDHAIPGLDRFGGWVGKAAGQLKDGFAGDPGRELRKTLNIDKAAKDWAERFAGIRRAVGDMWAKVQPIVADVQKWIGTKWKEMQPAVTVLFDAISGAVSSAMELVQAIIKKVTDAISFIWDTWGKNIKAGIGNALDTIVGIFTGLFTTVSGIWTTLTGLLTGDWDKARAGLDKITDGVKKIFTSAFDGIKKHVINAFDATVTGVSKAWDSVKGVVAKPINVVIGYVNKGIIGSYNWVAKKLGMKELSPIPEMSTGSSSSGRGSSGGRGANVALAGGGFVRLPWDPARRDPYVGTTPGGGAFRFEGEEFFVKRSSTARLERNHPGLLSYMNRYGDLPQHAGGGLTSFRGHRFTERFVEALKAAEAIAKATMHISQGGYRPRTSYSGSSHAKDAVDLTGGGYRRFVAPLRAVGVAAWDRAGKGNWVDHAHGVPLPGYGTAGGSAVWQAQDYLRGGDGLGGRDNGPKVTATGAPKGLMAAISAGFDTVKDWVGAIGEKITGALPAPGGGMIGDLVTGVANKLKTGVLDWAKTRLGYAAGARAAGSGTAWVGERGPELVNLAGGERIHAAHESGTAIMASFAQGLSDGARTAQDATEAAMAHVRDFFPYSPAKKGPFSGAGYSTSSGVALISDFGVGIQMGSGKAAEGVLAAQQRLDSGWAKKVKQGAADRVAVARAERKQLIAEAQARVDDAVKAERKATGTTAKKNAKARTAAARTDLKNIRTTTQNKIDSEVAQERKTKSSVNAQTAKDKKLVSAAESISKTMSRSWGDVTKSVDKSNTRLYGIIDKLKATDSPVTKQLASWINTQRKDLVKILKERDKIRDQLADAKDDLQALRNEKTGYITSLAESTTDLQGITGRRSAVDMIRELTKQRNATTQYRKDIATLQKMGVTNAVLEQITAQGVDVGGATAAAIIAGGPAALAQINALADQIEAESAKMATGVGKQMHDAGIAVAKGLVDGLKAEDKALTAAADALATKIATQIKTKLQIKSPSRLAKWWGQMTGRGLGDGLTDETKTVERAADRLAIAAIPRPRITRLPSAAVASSATTTSTDDLERIIAAMLLALQDRPIQNTVVLDEGDLRRVIASEIRKGR